MDEFNINPEEIGTEEELQSRLNSYAQALASEFEEKSKAIPANVEQYATDFFKGNIHAAAAQIAYLSVNAESESIKLRASQYIVERALKDGRDDGDPIAEMLKSLTKKESGDSTPTS